MSQHKGVYQRGGRFEACVNRGGKHYAGTFGSAEEAARTYDAKVRELEAAEEEEADRTSSATSGGLSAAQVYAEDPPLTNSEQD